MITTNEPSLVKINSAVEGYSWASPKKGKADLKLAVTLIQDLESGLAELRQTRIGLMKTHTVSQVHGRQITGYDKIIGTVSTHLMNLKTASQNETRGTIGAPTFRAEFDLFQKIWNSEMKAFERTCTSISQSTGPVVNHQEAIQKDLISLFCSVLNSMQ